MQGKTLIFTGEGKGKTTASLGLALRSAGWGLKVLFIQFLKGDWETGEKKSLESISNIEHRIFGEGVQISEDEKVDEQIKRDCEEGFRFSVEMIHSDRYDVVILDEINILVHFNIIAVEDVVELIKNKPEDVELVLTGRYAPRQLIEIADLVSDIVNVKHYFDEDTPPRKGIEY